jgi:rare lipoprotein A
MKRVILFLMPVLLLSFILKTDYEQTGRASYYANKFEGRRTSSGEVFKQSQLTAAHKTLKFGTLVRVTNLKNGSSIIVKVNDRLGKTSSCVIDLTLKGAKELNFVHSGHTRVKIESL